MKRCDGTCQLVADNWNFPTILEGLIGTWCTPGGNLHTVCVDGSRILLDGFFDPRQGPLVLLRLIEVYPSYNNWNVRMQVRHDDKIPFGITIALRGRHGLPVLLV